MTSIVTLFNHAYLAATTPAARALRSALPDPRSAQLKILRGILAANQTARFGRAHGFSSTKGYADFVARVPMCDYDDIREEIDRLRHGGHGILTSDRVEFLEPTGGSSGPSKLIPYTRSLKRQIGRAAGPWIRDLLVHRPALRSGRSYWAISPPVRPNNEYHGVVPIGARRDSDYLPRTIASVLDRVLVLPGAVSMIGDLEVSRYATLRSLLAASDLSFVSVWNPSFLTLLMEELDKHFERLLHDLERGGLSPSVALDPSVRARLDRALPARPDLAVHLRRRFGSQPPNDLGELWTSLQTISCWTDGHAARSVEAMRRRFPNVEVQGKGLMSTEGVVSIPLTKHPAPIAAITSHFIEFLPEMGGAALLADEVAEGSTYEVVITTGGGLYRYRTKDLVRVCGHIDRTPMLRFVGRADAASDLCGEKLTPAFVEQALAAASDATGVRPVFAFLSPRWGEPPCYDLWLELADGAAEATQESEWFGSAVEQALRTAHHYDLCRTLGQLGPLHIRSVRDGERSYERRCTNRGQRAGSVKPPALISEFGMDDLFEEVAI